MWCVQRVLCVLPETGIPLQDLVLAMCKSPSLLTNSLDRHGTAAFRCSDLTFEEGEDRLCLKRCHYVVAVPQCPGGLMIVWDGGPLNYRKHNTKKGGLLNEDSIHKEDLTELEQSLSDLLHKFMTGFTVAGANLAGVFDPSGGLSLM